MLGKKAKSGKCKVYKNVIVSDAHGNFHTFKVCKDESLRDGLRPEQIICDELEYFLKDKR